MTTSKLVHPKLSPITIDDGTGPDDIAGFRALGYVTEAEDAKAQSAAAAAKAAADADAEAAKGKKSKA